MSSNNNVKALKSGIWYTAASFITKSIGFITTPIFARLLTKNEVGLYSNYASWLNTIMVLATLNLGASFISARFDFKDDFDGYISSTLVLSSVVTCIWAAIINLFPKFVSSFTGVEIQYLNVMIVYLLLFAAVDMFQARERYYYGYKKTVFIGLSIALSTAFLSVYLVTSLNDRLLGRIVGSAIPTILIGLVLYAILIYRGRSVNIKYWKYALPISLPYVPHVLSLSLLNAMDKMMITKQCGADDNALYSIVYSCGAIITILVTSLNSAFSPWLGEKLNQNRLEEIRKISKYYVAIFIYAACGVMLISPELLYYMGGEQYMEALYVMPPIELGCVCQFLYTMYVNIEQFKKKTVGMAIASMIAALSNFILNYIFIPQYGYVAAAYTTLASYLVLLFIHMFIVKRLGLIKAYSGKVVAVVILFMSGYTVIIHLLFKAAIVRYLVIALYALASLAVAYKFKDKIIKILKEKKK